LPKKTSTTKHAFVVFVSFVVPRAFARLRREDAHIVPQETPQVRDSAS
jgi:hypothetical protein